MEVKDYMNNDPRKFFNFRKDNEAEKGSQGMIPAQGHCFSTFLMVRLRMNNRKTLSYLVRINYVKTKEIMHLQPIKSLFE